VDVENIFPAAAAPTLERFRSWHTQRAGSVYAESVFERRLSELDRIEERLIARIDREQARFASTTLTLTPQAEAEAPGSEAGEMVSMEFMAFRDRSSERSLLQRIIQARSSIERLIKLDSSSGGREVFRQFAYHAGVARPAPGEPGDIAAPEGFGGARTSSGDVGGDAAYPAERNVAALISEVIERSVAEIAGIEAAELALDGGGLELLDARIPGEPLGRGEGDDAAGEKLKSELDEYDRRNREIAKNLAERASGKIRENASKELQAQEAASRTAIDALAGLDNSDKLLKELREAAPPKGGGRMAPEVNLLLASLPPERREVYERLLYHARQGEPGEDGGVRSVSLAELNAEIADATREAAETETRRIEREIRSGTEILRDRIVRTIEQTGQARRDERAVSRVWPRGAPRMLHRREEAPGLPEAGLARPGTAAATLAKELTIRETSTKEEHIGSESIRAVRETQAKSLRDIDDAISKALAGQIRSIESRIYSGVERKLDIERARRGK
jgi:hypothetical protein